MDLLCFLLAGLPLSGTARMAALPHATRNPTLQAMGFFRMAHLCVVAVP